MGEAQGRAPETMHGLQGHQLGVMSAVQLPWHSSGQEQVVLCVLITTLGGLVFLRPFITNGD